MTRKRKHIMTRAWEFLIESPIEKVRRPITTIITKRRKIIINILQFNKNKFKSFRLLKQQQRKFGFMGDYEYEFSSPSSTQLFGRSKKKRTVFLCLVCGGSDAVEENDDEFGLGDELLEKGSDVAELEMEEEVEVDELEDEEEEEEEDESIDRRADKFIERFHQEMRLQRQKSVVQFMEMLDRSC